MEPMDRFVRAEWHVDFGERGRLEAEVDHHRVWLALPQHLGAEVWAKSVAGSHDFRLVLTRTADGFEMTIDRGPGLGRSWPEEAPKIAINLDNSSRRGTIYSGPARRRSTTDLASGFRALSRTDPSERHV